MKNALVLFEWHCVWFGVVPFAVVPLVPICSHQTHQTDETRLFLLWNLSNDINAKQLAICFVSVVVIMYIIAVGVICKTYVQFFSEQEVWIRYWSLTTTRSCDWLCHMLCSLHFESLWWSMARWRRFGHRQFLAGVHERERLVSVSFSCIRKCFWIFDLSMKYSWDVLDFTISPSLSISWEAVWSVLYLICVNTVRTFGPCIWASEISSIDSF